MLASSVCPCVCSGILSEAGVCVCVCVCACVCVSRDVKYRGCVLCVERSLIRAGRHGSGDTLHQT